MTPSHSDGDLVLVDVDAYLDALPRPGDVVLAKHPFKGGLHIVKRVSRVTEEGRFFLLGDNRLESSDSRGFGALRLAQIVGKIIGRAHES